jgi:hypothetical protein
MRTTGTLRVAILLSVTLSVVGFQRDGKHSVGSAPPTAGGGETRSGGDARPGLGSSAERSIGRGVAARLNSSNVPVGLWSQIGAPVSTGPGSQDAPAVVQSDEGIIVLWQDDRSREHVPDIYGGFLGWDGGQGWEKDGVVLAAAPRITDGGAAPQQNVVAAPDEAGGAISAWEDFRDPHQYDVYAQRISAAGEPQWQQDGIPVATACWTVGGVCANNKRQLDISPDGSGGVIIVWQEMRDGFHFSAWAQRLDQEGAPQWDIDGVPVAYGSFNANYPKVVSDSMEGGIFSWIDNRGGIYAQRLNQDGEAQWALNGVPISTSVAQVAKAGHALISDGFGGVILTWVEDHYDGSDSNIYAQRVDSTGASVWGVSGVPICTRDFFQYSPAMTTDGAGGAIIVWEDQGASPPGSGVQYAVGQRISSTGTTQWTPDGVIIATDHAHVPSVAADGSGGAFVVWSGNRMLIDPETWGPRIGAQRLDVDGNKEWPEEGFEVYFQEDGNCGFTPRPVSDGSGGLVVVWGDYRLTGGYPRDLFAQRVSDQIELDAGRLLFSWEQWTIGETAGSLEVEVRRHFGSEGDIEVDYATVEGYAAEGTDFLATSGTLSWADGDDSPKSFDVEIVDDSQGEDTEDFYIILSSPTNGAVLGQPQSIRIQILDDDPYVIWLPLIMKN